MSDLADLADLLGGELGPGTFRWTSAAHEAQEAQEADAAHEADPADVRRAVEDAGWRFAHVDGSTATTKVTLLDALGEALGFPDHYGRNFDALADCLRDVDAGDRQGTVLMWDAWGQLADADPHAFAVALTVLGVRTGAKRGGPFVVLLRGEGRGADDVPALA